MNFRDKKYFICFILIGLCFLVYANSLKGGFVSDDVGRVLDNPHISRFSGNWFRPQELLNSFCYRIAGFNVLPYHLSSVVLHSLNSILVFFFLRLFFGVGPSALGAALFAVHPVHSEAVAWISGRAYLISTLFILASYLLYNKPGRITYPLLLALFLYFIKENYTFYAFFPLLIVLSDIIFNKWRKNWKLWIPFLAITALRIITAGHLIQERVAMATSYAGRTDAWQNMFFYFVYSVFSHLWLMLWPARLTLYHEPVIFYQWAMWLGFIALCVFACFLPYIFKKAKSILLGIVIFVLFLAPTYSPFPVANAVAERYVYLPSILLSIIFAFLYEACTKAGKRNWLIVPFIFIICAYGVRTVIRNQDWKDAKSLWGATLKVSPDSAGAHNNAGFIYLKDKDVGRAIEEFNTAIKMAPAKAESYNNLGVACKIMGKLDEAVALYKRAIALNPDYAEAYNNLANVYQGMGKQEEAIASYNRAIELDPDYIEALNNLGIAYKNIGKPKEAIASYNRAIELNPDYAAAYKNLAVIYYLQGQYGPAIEYSDRAIALGYKPDPIFLKLLKPYRKK